MIKKTITYKNLDGDSVTGDFYFSISLNETLTEVAEGSLVQEAQSLAKGGTSGAEIYKNMTNILRRSIGRRSEDGSHLIKTPEFTLGFMNSDAFSVLLFDLLNNADKAVEFFTEIFPRDMAEKVKELQSQQALPGMEQVPVVKQLQNGWLEVSSDINEIPHDTLINMPASQFHALFGKDPKKWAPSIMQAAYMRKIGEK